VKIERQWESAPKGLKISVRLKLLKMSEILCLKSTIDTRMVSRTAPSSFELRTTPNK
jgi:hypothetical protein